MFECLTPAKRRPAPTVANALPRLMTQPEGPASATRGHQLCQLASTNYSLEVRATGACINAAGISG